MCELCVPSSIAQRHESGSEGRRWRGGKGKPYGRVGRAMLRLGGFLRLGLFGARFGMLGSALCLPLDPGTSWRSKVCCCLLNQSPLSAAICHQDVVPAVLLMWCSVSSPGLNWPACLAPTLSGLAFSCSHHAMPLQVRRFPQVPQGFEDACAPAGDLELHQGNSRLPLFQSTPTLPRCPRNFEHVPGVMKLDSVRSTKDGVIDWPRGGNPRGLPPVPPCCVLSSVF